MAFFNLLSGDIFFLCIRSPFVLRAGLESLGESPGIDVMILKIFSPKNWRVFLLKTKLN
jgi:hypothetical protein